MLWVFFFSLSLVLMHCLLFQISRENGSSSLSFSWWMTEHLWDQTDLTSNIHRVVCFSGLLPPPPSLFSLTNRSWVSTLYQEVWIHCYDTSGPCPRGAHYLLGKHSSSKWLITLKRDKFYKGDRGHFDRVNMCGETC